MSPNTRDYSEIKSSEGKAILSTVKRLQEEVDRNRGDIRRIENEVIPDMQSTILSAIGNMANRFDKTIEKLRDDLELKHSPSSNMANVIPLGPIREEMPSRPEIEEIAEERAQKVYAEAKKDSIINRAKNAEDEKRDLVKERRQLRGALVIALVAAVAGPIIEHFVK